MEINQRIILACRELSSTKGFHNLTMDELAAQAGVSKRTIYRYFRSKEEIIAAAIDDFFAGVTKEFELVFSKEIEPHEIWVHMIKYIFSNGAFFTGPQGLKDLRLYYPNLWKKIDNFRTERIKTLIEHIMHSGKAVKFQDTDPRIITAVVLASIQAVINPQFILENNLNFEDTVRQLGKIILDILT